MRSTRSEGHASTRRGTKKKEVTEAVSPKLSPEEKQQVIAKWKALPPDQKKTVISLMKTACSWCEGELKVPNVSTNHGICARHMAAQYRQMGMEPPKKSGPGTPDLSQVPRELVDLASLITSISKEKHPLYKGVKEGRCEDWPCCGHGDDCPDRDPETGEEVWGCAKCGRRLPRGARSSLCSSCIRRMHQAMDDPTGQDLDNWQQ